MRRRGRGRRGPGVINTMARTAVIAGTATAVSGNVARRQEARVQQAAGPPQAQESPSGETTSPDQASTEHVITQLKELAALKEQGILTDEEFAAQKARLLG